MMSEKKLNFLILIFLFLVPLFSMLLNDIYITTLFSKIVILAIAGIGLNLILGYGGMVSFGHLSARSDSFGGSDKRSTFVHFKTVPDSG